jgi:hypothetical protein
MKKLVFLLPIAALAMASCSNDSVVEQPATKVISAEALQIYPDIQGITRGTVWDNSNFISFKLNTDGKFQTVTDEVNSASAAKFSEQQVTKVSGTWYIGDGTTQTDYYWPSKSASSYFQAWAPTDVAAGSYVASATIAEQKDILVAYNSGSATDFEAGVPLKFRHILSQIVVKADNEANTKIQIKVKGVRLNNINSTRTWALPEASTVSSLPDAVWKDVSTRSDKDYIANFTAKTLNGTAQDITGDYPMLLIPQALGAADISAGSGQYLSVLLQIQDIQTGVAADKVAIFPKASTAADQHFAWAAADINTEWLPGKKYIYTLHFTENGYGKVDKDQEGSDDPDDGTTTNDPDPGLDVVDTPVKLILDVEVIDWVDGTSANESINM